MGRRSGAWVAALAAAGLLTACDSSERTGVQVADAAAREDAAPVNPASIEALTLLFQVSGALVELGPDDAVAWEWGSQGGTMVLPALRAPADFPFTVNQGARVRLQHRAVPGEEAAFARVAAEYHDVTLDTFVNAEPGGGFIIPALFDQLGYDTLDGVVLELEVSVVGYAGTIRRTLRLGAMAPPPPPDPTDPCVAFAPELGGRGCVYANIPVEATIVGFDACAGCDACTPTTAQATFAVADAQAIACLVSRDWTAERVAEALTRAGRLGPSAAPECLSAWGAMVEATLPAFAPVQIEGTCSPIGEPYFVPPNDGACDVCPAP